MGKQHSRLAFFSNPTAMATAGITIPVFLTILIVLAPFARGNYNLIEDGISQFALGKQSWMGELYFVLAALMITTFARSLTLSLPPSGALNSATKMLYIMGLSMVLLLFFKTEPLRGSWPIHRVIHEALSAITCTLLPIACFFISHSIKKDAVWHSLAGFTAITGVFLAAIDAASVVYLFQIHIVGLQERLLSLGAFTLIIVISARILRRSRSRG
jgi:hypothetical protein